MRNRKLARAIHDMGFGEFRRQLAYKVQASSSTVVVADRWFPSSRLCRICGTLNDGLTLKDRPFECDGSGHVEDCDLHAACNLARYPELQGNLDACGHRSAGWATSLSSGTRVDEAGILAYVSRLLGMLERAGNFRSRGQLKPGSTICSPSLRRP